TSFNPRRLPGRSFPDPFPFSWATTEVTRPKSGSLGRSPSRSRPVHARRVFMRMEEPMSRARALLVAALALVVPALAHADDDFHRAPNAAVRVVGPGYPDLVGASASLYLPRPLALEVGISRSFGPSGSAYGRVGPALSLRQPAPR